MSGQVLQFPQRTQSYGSQVDRHSLTKTQVRRLGGLLHKTTCSCGIAFESADEQQVLDANFAFHALVLGLFDEED